MKRYCINKNPQFESTGEHEIHVWNCDQGPKDENKVDLGELKDCIRAIQVAILRGFENVDGCKYCCEECHTK